MGKVYNVNQAKNECVLDGCVICVNVRVREFNSTFNNISVISWPSVLLGQKKRICVFPTDPKILPPTLTFFMPKKKIDRQNREIRPRFRVCFRLQQFSSFPCTFDRCLEPKTLYCMSNN